MSQSPSLPLSDDAAPSKSVPGWIASGLLGLAVGAGAGIVATQGYEVRIPGLMAPAPEIAPAGGPPAAPGMGGGGMPMGMGAPMMGGGGGGGGGKRALTSLVGKLELLTRPDLRLYVELDADQAKALAAKLAEFEQSKTMSPQEAEENVESLEKLLTADQKAVVDAIGLPFGRGGQRGPGGGGMGRPGGGMMGGGGDPDENPFTQETNQKRLGDLLARLSPASAEGSDSSQ